MLITGSKLAKYKKKWGKYIYDNKERKGKTNEQRTINNRKLATT
jgi:hypothetical protein